MSKAKTNPAEEMNLSEAELTAMADALLAEADAVEETKAPATKKKNSKKAAAAPAEEVPAKTNEEKLADLLAKGKKNGKLTLKEIREIRRKTR